MKHSALPRIDGIQLSLRLVQPEDALYIHGLRTDPTYNGYLSTVTGTVEDQRSWIEAYKTREAAGSEYYFVIERKDGVRCGVVRLYDIIGDQFTWGSWILDYNKPRKAALESALLIYRYGFEVLGLSRSVFEVRRENENTLAFHRRLKATQTHEDDRNIYFVYSREQFVADKLAHMDVLQSGSNND
jgi:RimJ/RimL family protein N-acetyltransferase